LVSDYLFDYCSLTTFKVVVSERVLVLQAPSLLLCLNYSSFTPLPQGEFKAGEFKAGEFKATGTGKFKANGELKK